MLFAKGKTGLSIWKFSAIRSGNAGSLRATVHDRDTVSKIWNSIVATKWMRCAGLAPTGSRR